MIKNLSLIAFAFVLCALPVHAAMSAPRQINVGPVAYSFVSQKDQKAFTAYEFAAKNQSDVKATSMFTVEVCKDPSISPDIWRMRMLTSVMQDPKCQASTTGDNIVILIIRSPNQVEYNLWKFGMSTKGTAVANGLAWHFAGPQAEEEFQKFSTDGGKKAYDAFLQMQTVEQ